MAFNQSFPRDRDCYTLFKGDTFPVDLHPSLVASGWQGGQGIQWVDDPDSDFVVGASDGLYGGFLLWGSNESSDQFVSTTGNQQKYGYGVFCFGGWLIATRTFERYTYASRQVGPLVELAYIPGERLRFSLRGYWTKEDEFTLSGDPRAPNGYYIGSVVQVPSADNEHYLTLQTSI